MVNILASSLIDRVFEPRSGQTKTVICYFYTKHEILRDKSYVWLDRNHSCVSERSDMFTRELAL